MADLDEIKKTVDALEADAKLHSRVYSDSQLILVAIIRDLLDRLEKR